MNPMFDALIAPLAERDTPLLLLADGGALSGREIFHASTRIAHVLASVGVAPGDRVAVQTEKSPMALALYLACIRAGSVFLPLNTAYTTNELAYFIGDAEPKLVVCDPSAEAALTPVAAEKGAAVLTLDAAGEGSLTARAEGQSESFETAERSRDDLATILYTSGTTGRSKGAMLTQGNLLSNVEALIETWRFTRDDVLLHALPIFHAHGLFVATNIMLRVEGTMIFLPRFDLERALALLPKATSMMGVPTFYTRLLADPRFNRELVGHIRLFVSGSAPLLAETHRAFEARTGHRILERYGMTETSMNCSNPFEGERRPGSVGPALPGVEARVVNPETGETLPTGEVGVLEVRGPNVFKGYWRMPEKTAEEFREDGFFITGDIATIAPDGYVTIVGRAKDLVISGGYNVYPKEVEDAIDQIDGVVESAVIGAPHPDFGEGVVAVVVPQPGAALSEKDVTSALADKLARYKQPKRVFFIDALPRNTMGKVQKNVLREKHGDVFE